MPSPPKTVRFASYAQHVAAEEDEEFTSADGSPHSDCAVVTPPDVIYMPLPTKGVPQPFYIPIDLDPSLCRPMRSSIDLTADASQVQASFTPDMYINPATSSSSKSLVLICSRLGWRFRIDAPMSSPHLTPAILVMGLYRALREEVKKAEYLAMSDKRREEINSARARRCGAVPGPVQKIDFLGPMPRLVGFAMTETVDMLRFSVVVEN